MRRLYYVTLKCLRQFAFAAALSLFVVLICMKIQAETYEYDALNRVTKVIYDDQSYTVYKYDANGNIISQNYYDNGEKEDSDSGTASPEENDTEDKKDTPIQENPTKQHKKGMKAQNKNATYVITSVKKKTASFYRLKNKKRQAIRYRIRSKLTVSPTKSQKSHR